MGIVREGGKTWLYARSAAVASSKGLWSLWPTTRWWSKRKQRIRPALDGQWTHAPRIIDHRCAGVCRPAPPTQLDLWTDTDRHGARIRLCTSTPGRAALCPRPCLSSLQLAPAPASTARKGAASPRVRSRRRLCTLHSRRAYIHCPLTAPHPVHLPTQVSTSFCRARLLSPAKATSTPSSVESGMSV
ncbi:hypothetical protein K466DRAFT_7805 [Polyporus arcularius HHB13444]|uniref:Uncharacterized protein n=1 Tax=Polyporus arcularius HHB13444 TaxID=1314778 RepID=A0A5C3NSX0_9APHY|nr:hypothetical protein K466DRAFT_7805 [Polyporus arcularius HHB13444]